MKYCFGFWADGINICAQCRIKEKCKEETKKRFEVPIALL